MKAGTIVLKDKIINYKVNTRKKKRMEEIITVVALSGERKGQLFLFF